MFEWPLSGRAWALGWGGSRSKLRLRVWGGAEAPGQPLPPHSPDLAADLCWALSSRLTLGTRRFIRNGTDGLK